MANRTAASIDTALNTLLAPKIAQQINRSVPLAQVLPVVGPDGKNISWNVQVGTAAPGTPAIAEDADVSVYNVDTKIPATLQFGHLHDAVTISSFSMAAARRAGPQALENLFMSELKDSSQRLAKHINKGAWTGSGATNNLHGLRAAVSPIADTGIYAGIDPSTYADWAGNVVGADAGAGARDNLSFGYIRQLRRKIIDRFGVRPDLYVCNPLQFDKFGALFDGQREFQQTTEIVVGGRKIQLDGGFTALYFEGAPVIWDSDCPDDIFVALNTSHVRFVNMPAVDEPLGGGSGAVALSGTQTDMSSGQLGLQAKIKRLAEAGNYTRFGLFVDLQLQVDTRKACGVITNLTQS